MTQDSKNSDLVLLRGSEKTGFLYKIEGGMEERDKDEIEAMDSGYVVGMNWPRIVSDSVDLRHRMTYIRRRGLGFSFIGTVDSGLDQRLRLIDNQFPRILAHMISDAYRDGTQRMSDLIDNVSSKNPAGFTNVRETKIYHKMCIRFLLKLISKEGVEMDPEMLLENTFFSRIPAEKYGCTEIVGNVHEGYTTKLILQIEYRPKLKA